MYVNVELTSHDDRQPIAHTQQKPVLYEVLQIFTQVEVQLLYYRMTQISKSIKVAKMVYTLLSKVHFVLFWAEKYLSMKYRNIIKL